MRNNGARGTVVGGVERFEHAAAQTQMCNAIPLTVQNLQTREQGCIQLTQTVIAHVQLCHVTQKLRLIGNHAGDVIQTEETKRCMKHHNLTSNCTGQQHFNVTHKNPSILILSYMSKRIYDPFSDMNISRISSMLNV